MEVEIGRGKKARRAYGFDDVAIVPSRRTRDPDDVDISWTLGPYRFELPLLASAMDGVVSPETNQIPGIPDLGSVPLTAWSWAVSEATRTLPTAELGDEDPAGSRHLREVVTAYHRRVRSGCAVAEDAVVVSGFRQGLAFAHAVLARHGIGRIALEDPGPRDHDVIARRAGLDAVPVPVDDHGLDVDRLGESGARAVLLTPPSSRPRRRWASGPTGSTTTGSWPQTQKPSPTRARPPSCSASATSASTRSVEASAHSPTPSAARQPRRGDDSRRGRPDRRSQASSSARPMRSPSGPRM